MCGLVLTSCTHKEEGTHQLQADMSSFKQCSQSARSTPFRIAQSFVYCFVAAVHTINWGHTHGKPLFCPPTEYCFYDDCPLVKLLRKLGPALKALTSLQLDSWNPDTGQAPTGRVQEQALSVLLSFCPAVTSFITDKHLSAASYRYLGQACPLLTSLTINRGWDDLPVLDQLLQLLPSLVPRLVYLPNPFGEAEELDDMSKHAGILSLDVSRICFHHKDGNHMEAEWLLLPPKLQHLVCGGILGGPPPLRNGAPLLGSLLTVRVTGSLYLDALGRLLRAAPALQSLGAVQEGESCPAERDKGFDAQDLALTIQSPFTLSIAVDLALLQQRLDAGLCMNATYFFCGEQEQPSFLGCRHKGPQQSLHSFVSALPCMTHVTKCILKDCWLPDPTPFFMRLPSLRILSLSDIDIDDSGLHAVAACVGLQKLQMYTCNNVSTDGLYELCRLLSSLRHVYTYDCALLPASSLSQFAPLLDRQNLCVEIIDR